MSDGREERDLVLAPATDVYMQDVTTGMVKIFVGPCVINQTAQEVPVVYHAESGAFRRCSGLGELGVGPLEMARQFFDFLPADKLQVLRHSGEPAGSSSNQRRPG